MNNGTVKKAVGIAVMMVIGGGALAKTEEVANMGASAIETYKVALRAYVATQQVEKVEKAIQALEKLVKAGGDAEARAKLTRIYVSLGRELQDQLKRLRNEKKTEQLE
ncbi:MAG: hypothetical protein ACC661_12610, partial [Verrucomicrobiales bacterium]